MKGFVNLTHTNNGKINQLKTEVDNLKNNTVGKDTTDLENYYTKNQTYTKDEVNSKITGVYKYKGSVQTYADLPTQNNQEGDVYNVIQAYQEYPAGTNFAWTSQNTWDALGGNIDLSNYYTKEQVDDVAIKTHKQIVLGANGVQEGTGVYNFTVENPNDYLPYKTNFTKFLVDLHLPIAGALDLTKDVAITFGDTVYYLYNILTGNEHAKIGSLKQVDKYNNETGYRFIVELTYFENADITGFAIIPTVSMSDVLALTSDEMDNYMADGGLTDGQLAVCAKVIANGYDEGGLYRFDITYPSTFTWTKLSGGGETPGEPIAEAIKNNTTQIVPTSGEVKIGGANSQGSGIAIGRDANTAGGNFQTICIGNDSKSTSGSAAIAIGGHATANATDAIAVGYLATASKNKAIQLGQGTNSTTNSFQIGDDNIYKTDTHTLTVQNAQVNGNNVYGVLQGETDPTETTVGAVGQFYISTATNPASLWLCTKVEVVDSATTYTWTKQGGKQLYQHNVVMTWTARRVVTFTLTTLDSTPITSGDLVLSLLVTNGFLGPNNILPCNVMSLYTQVEENIDGLYSIGIADPNIYFRELREDRYETIAIDDVNKYIKIDKTYGGHKFSTSSINSVTDTVVAL